MQCPLTGPREICWIIPRTYIRFYNSYIIWNETKCNETNCIEKTETKSNKTKRNETKRNATEKKWKIQYGMKTNDTIRFVTFRFVSLHFVSFRFDRFRFVRFRFVSFCLISFRSVSFRFVSTINIVSFIFFYYRESKPPFCLQYEKSSPVNIVYRKINWQKPRLHKRSLYKKIP
jgi:hypothetical protein